MSDSTITRETKQKLADGYEVELAERKTRLTARECGGRQRRYRGDGWEIVLCQATRKNGEDQDAERLERILKSMSDETELEASRG